VTETAADKEREKLYMESVRRFNEQRREQHRAAWCEHYQRMRALHGALADEYEEKLKRLEQTASPPGPAGRGRGRGIGS
jgi:hypothetical protein